jgi:hypothetical protein
VETGQFGVTPTINGLSDPPESEVPDTPIDQGGQFGMLDYDMIYVAFCQVTL